MKKYRFVPSEIWALIVGILAILLAVSIIQLSHGHEVLYGIVFGLVAIGLAIAGFLVLSVIGLGVALILVWLVNRLAESFPVPIAAVLVVAGIGFIIFFLSESLFKVDPDSPRPQHKGWKDYYETRTPLFCLSTTIHARQKRDGTFKPCSVKVGYEIDKWLGDDRWLLVMKGDRLSPDNVSPEVYKKAINGRVFVRDIYLDKDLGQYKIIIGVYEP